MTCLKKMVQTRTSWMKSELVMFFFFLFRPVCCIFCLSAAFFSFSLTSPAAHALCFRKQMDARKTVKQRRQRPLRVHSDELVRRLRSYRRRRQLAFRYVVFFFIFLVTSSTKVATASV